MNDDVTTLIGRLIRYSIGSFAFYFWQNNLWAALFMFCLLITLDSRK